MNFNKAIVVGNLTRDPEIRTTPNGHNVATFGVATNRYWSDQQGQRQVMAEFHNIVAWGKLADISGQYLKKGSLVLIEGRLQTRSWEGQDGVKRYRTEIVAESMQLGPRGSGNSSNTGASAQAKASEDIPTIQQDEPVSMPASFARQEKEEVNVENIPF